MSQSNRSGLYGARLSESLALKRRIDWTLPTQ